MRTWLMLGLFCALATGQSLPNQAGNSKLSLSGTAISDRKEVTALMGIDLGEGFIVVKIRAVPQTLQPLRLSIDDFTLVSRKNGEKSGAMAPSTIAGSAAIIVTRGPSQSGQGIGTTNPMGMPNGMNGIGNSGSVDGGMAEIRIENSKKQDPRLPILEAKVFQDRETLEPTEGLLYFSLEGKLKPKDLGLIYAGPAGRLVIDFK